MELLSRTEDVTDDVFQIPEESSVRVGGLGWFRKRRRIYTLGQLREEAIHIDPSAILLDCRQPDSSAGQSQFYFVPGFGSDAAGFSNFESAIGTFCSTLLT
jgi:hypothetical protein